MAADRPLLADGVSHPLMADGVSFALMATVSGAAPEVDPAPYQRASVMDGRRSSVLDARTSTILDNRRTRSI